MKQPAAREAVVLLKTMTRVLCAVGVLALIFTTVNVTRFAASRDVPLPIAILLDPMLGTALAGVLYVDARLASWGIRPPAWSTALRWSAGSVAALMNSWESLWPDGQIGWPKRADPAAVLLHLTPALLLILLTETIAAYRRTVADLLDRIGPADPTEHPVPLPTTTPRSATIGTDPKPSDTGPSHDRSTPHHPPTTAPDPTRAGHPAPRTGDSAPHDRPTASAPPPNDDRAADADVWARATALDAAARTTAGKPVSIWRLRTDLCIGPRRAHAAARAAAGRAPRPSAP